MRMTASWFRSLDLPHTRLWRDSTAPESGLPSDCHPDCIIVLEGVRMRPGEIEPRTRRWKKCVTLLDSKSPIQGTARAANQANFYKNLAIMAAYLLLAITGAGRYSLDHRAASAPSKAAAASAYARLPAARVTAAQ